MPNSLRPLVIKIGLRVPVILMVLAATAIPVELRPMGHFAVDFHLFSWDFIANIAGYIPLGFVLAGFGPLRAVLAATTISTVAETAQLVIAHRVAQAPDIFSNTLGAIAGIAVATHWKVFSPAVKIQRAVAFAAMAIAFALIFGVWIMFGLAPNTRGATFPGTLEARWKLDETGGRVAVDASGHGLSGRYSKEPIRLAGSTGSTVAFDGATEYIDLGRSSALRLVGSMTITAWINARSFPVDDAAVVSKFGDRGYQLDVTADRGPRTIGFKLHDPCGNLMVRYGSTPLAVGHWYHIAGVYDAEAQTLNVYLNGESDDGSLSGVVCDRQLSSRLAAYVGRRSDLKGFEFPGSIREVRIYSFALTKAQIGADLRGAVVDNLTPPKTADVGSRVEPLENRNPWCSPLSEYEDSKIPGVAAVLGVLVAMGCVWYKPSAHLWLCLIASFAAGLLLLPPTVPTLPSFNLWTIPLTSLAGGASVALSVSRQKA